MNGHGDHVLAGVEYEIHATEPGEDPPDIFADEGENLKVSEADGWRRVGPVPEIGDVWAIHVWVHLPNPDGLFAACQPTGLFWQDSCVPNALCGGSP